LANRSYFDFSLLFKIFSTSEINFLLSKKFFIDFFSIIIYNEKFNLNFASFHQTPSNFDNAKEGRSPV